MGQQKLKANQPTNQPAKDHKKLSGGKVRDRVKIDVVNY